jgi:predicted flap endonuclease-1-like 5' DNA nuclease
MRIQGGGSKMSVRALVALFVGILLAGGGITLLVWLLWRLWSRGEQEKGRQADEFELQPQKAPEPEPGETARFSPPAQVPAVAPQVPGAKTVPPEVSSPQVAPSAMDAPESAVLPAEVEPSPMAVGDDSAAPGDLIVEEPAAQAPLPGATDDLQLIEGIGPKIAGVLREAGIDTFARLAATDTDRLAAILRQSDPRLLRLADPETWPEQARLAAAGEWDTLTQLQGTLRGGRRTR